MLRTGKSASTIALPTWTILFLAFLILIMSVHFLFDDLSFSSFQNFHTIQSEVTHQDDLVQISELIPQITSNSVIQITPVLFNVQAGMLSLNFNPPKYS
jgi:hypothetical protein